MPLLLLALLLPMLAWGQASRETLADPTKVDDGDKGSSRISDMITGVDQARKAWDAYNAGAGTVDAVRNPEKFKDALSFESMRGALRNQVVQYKSTKMGFNKFLNDILQKTSNILVAANRRVNMWRTTEPMLHYYGKRMHKVADNTVQVFGDFRPADVIDIDRKWSRRMENALLQDRATLLSFNAFLNSRQGNLEENERFFANLFFSNDLARLLSRDEASLQALLEMPEPSAHQKIPFQTLGFTTEAIHGARRIAAMAHGPAVQDNTMTQEAHNFAEIRRVLDDGDQTAEDTKQLAALISRRRAEIAVQTDQAEQILSALQTKYARLLLRSLESSGAAYQDYQATLNRIVNGGAFQDIDAHRRQIFREASLGR